ncbi:hypothetical protein QAD02_020455 [Eretmocerus hayati]|uniref:Uncharacterized protein n=1 Tax=Eretmocerus hayati TaxID=131215 RepID=A0ACC2PMJ3_9HYME|nr:hypothetical protein QAD02_020455 [Eretmocerus hayati]
MTESEFAVKYQITFPLPTIEHFKSFDLGIGQLIKVGENFVHNGMYEDFKKHFISTTNRNNSVKVSIGKLFKAMCSGEVMWNITAEKQNACTHVFAGETCIGDGEIICQSIGKMVNNGHEWDEGREKHKPTGKRMEEQSHAEINDSVVSATKRPSTADSKEGPVLPK